MVVGDVTLGVDVAFVEVAPSITVENSIAHDGGLRDYSGALVRTKSRINPAPGATINFFPGSRTAALVSSVVSLAEIRLGKADRVAVHMFGARSGYREGYFEPGMSQLQLCNPVGGNARNLFPVRAPLDYLGFPGDSGAFVWCKADGAFLGIQSVNGYLGSVPCSFVALGCVWCGPRTPVADGGVGGSL